MDNCQLLTVNSQLKKGYKQTDVGIIPSDWEVVCLGEMTIKVGSGITPTGGERVYKKDGRPFLRSQNVGWGRLLMEDIAFIDDKTHDTFKDTEILENDVFLNITGASIGRSAVADSRVKGGNVNQHVCIIRTVKDKLYPRLLNYLLLSRAGQKQIDSFQAGGNRQGLNFGQIRSFKIPLPPTKAEQAAIATALSDADALISSLEKLIAKKRNIKQGAMQQLLDGKKRLPGFGGKWKVQQLGDVLDRMANGATYKPTNSFGLSITRIETISNGIIDFSRVGYAEIDPELEKYRIEQGDILFSHINSLDHIGKVAFFEDENRLYHGMNLLLLRANERIDSRFLCFWLTSELGRRKVRTLAKQAVSQASINTSELKKVEIPLPTLPEQTAIAQVLSDMDGEIEALEKKLEKYKMIKLGMMQELLTGKTRLV